MNKLAQLSIILSIFCLFITPKSAFCESNWKRDISLGYNQTTGNTEKAQLSVEGAIKYEGVDTEFMSKANVFYSESDGTMDSQNWMSFTRYAFDFGEDMNWFNSYSVQVDHDRFADIDYRITPAVGVGYWLIRGDDFKWSLEGSLGYEITNYRSDIPDDEALVAIGRTYAEIKIFENSTLSEDLSVIPSLEENSVRIKSETTFTNPISEKMDINVKYIVDHDSDPSAGKEKTDTKLITGLKYSF